MRNVYSDAGATPNPAPVPMSNGLRQSDPLPGGGTCFNFEAQFCVQVHQANRGKI